MTYQVTQDQQSNKDALNGDLRANESSRREGYEILSMYMGSLVIMQWSD